MIAAIFVAVLAILGLRAAREGVKEIIMAVKDKNPLDDAESFEDLDDEEYEDDYDDLDDDYDDFEDDDDDDLFEDDDEEE